TCLPLRNASSASSKCVRIGVAITTASMSDARVRSSGRSDTPTPGQSRCAASSRFGLRSTMRDNSKFGLRKRFRARLGPQYPYPMTPTFIIYLLPPNNLSSGSNSLRNAGLRQVEDPPPDEQYQEADHAPDDKAY